ncbi:hypothetical protein AB0F43_09045 [Kribbella sp. NPDC023972]|uniref:hypothetical protein n=1 Tax=Kribbella sp. NPDC023972 TaxID=3154795 RepID=UPI0033CB57C1
MRSIGTSVSSAVAGVMLAQLTIELGGYTLPSQNGFRVVLIIGAAALAALAIAAFTPTRRPADVIEPATAQAAPATVS